MRVSIFPKDLASDFLGDVVKRYDPVILTQIAKTVGYMQNIYQVADMLTFGVLHLLNGN